MFASRFCTIVTDWMAYLYLLELLVFHDQLVFLCLDDLGEIGDHLRVPSDAGEGC